MLLTISYRSQTPEDLGFLLHKHPQKLHSFDYGFGKAYVFYPELDSERATVALLLDIDPIALSKNKKLKSREFALSSYVNDWPYLSSSSFMSVALGKVFSTAMTGRSKERPELAEQELELEVELALAKSWAGSELYQKLFEPLGWQLDFKELVLDQATLQLVSAEHAQSEKLVTKYSSLRLSGKMKLSEALKQLYVLLPVLDEQKHYWVSESEVEKLIRTGGSWLHSHPQRELITKRYLLNQREYLKLADDFWSVDSESEAESLNSRVNFVEPDSIESSNELVKTKISLKKARVEAVLAVLAETGAATVSDLGCGEGELLLKLVEDSRYSLILGSDVSISELNRAADRLHLNEAGEAKKQRIQLFQSALGFYDPRHNQVDAAVLMEVIEHIDSAKLSSATELLFGLNRPKNIIVTTPNSDYNSLYKGLASGEFRHPDHRFEFSRVEFESWANSLAEKFGYRVEFRTVGEVDSKLGSATQLAWFKLSASEEVLSK